MNCRNPRTWLKIHGMLWSSNVLCSRREAAVNRCRKSSHQKGMARRKKDAKKSTVLAFITGITAAVSTEVSLPGAGRPRPLVRREV